VSEVEDFGLGCVTDNGEEIEMERQQDIRRCANDLLLVERAKEWLLEDSND
jgi:hypothetical protein